MSLTNFRIQRRLFLGRKRRRQLCCFRLLLHAYVSLSLFLSFSLKGRKFLLILFLLLIATNDDVNCTFCSQEKPAVVSSLLVETISIYSQPDWNYQEKSYCPLKITTLHLKKKVPIFLLLGRVFVVVPSICCKQ